MYCDVSYSHHFYVCKHILKSEIITLSMGLLLVCCVRLLYFRLSFNSSTHRMTMQHINSNPHKSKQHSTQWHIVCKTFTSSCGAVSCGSRTLLGYPVSWSICRSLPRNWSCTFVHLISLQDPFLAATHFGFFFIRFFFFLFFGVGGGGGGGKLLSVAVYFEVLYFFVLYFGTLHSS